MKKTLAIIMALVLALGLLAGCNRGGGGETTAPGGNTGDPVEKYKVGILYIGEIGDAGYTFTHHQGILRTIEKIGADKLDVVWQENVNEDASCSVAIDNLVEQGCKYIIATSFGHMDFIAEAAEKYPDIIFSHCSGYKSNGENFNNFFGRIYQGRYLAGIAAGLRTETNKIGFVAAKQIPEVISGINAFLLGALSVNPEVEIYVEWTNEWFAPELEKSAAAALIARGCDVIGQHCDTTNPQIEAEAAGVWGCGYNADMTGAAPNSHLTAPIWKWEAFYTYSIEAAMAGSWDASDYYEGYPEGLVGISPISVNCAEGTEEAIEAYIEKILAGTHDVFDGPLVNQAGEEVCAAGVRLTDAEILSMNYFLKGVIGTLD